MKWEDMKAMPASIEVRKYRCKRCDSVNNAWQQERSVGGRYLCCDCGYEVIADVHTGKLVWKEVIDCGGYDLLKIIP